MKSLAVFPKSREVRVIDRPEPSIERPTQVLLEVLEVGICGTDREICAFEYGTPPAGSDHLVIGHEALARVVECGSDVTSVKRGDLVVPMVRRPCHYDTCTACVESRQDFCFTGEFRERGIKEAHGFMSELVVEEEKYLNVVPTELREHAVLVEPLTIAEKALIQLWQIQQRLPWSCPIVPGKKNGHCRRAVVLGAGPVGLLGAMALSAGGFDTYVYSRDAGGNEKALIAEEIGATYVSADTIGPCELPERIGAIDVVYEAAGASAAAFELMQALGANSVFIFTGVPGRKAPVSVDTDLLMRNLVLRNQIVFGTVNAGRDAFQSAIRSVATFADKWPDALARLISGRHSLEDSVGLIVGRPGGIKHVVAMAK